MLISHPWPPVRLVQCEPPVLGTGLTPPVQAGGDGVFSGFLPDGRQTFF